MNYSKLCISVLFCYLILTKISAQTQQKLTIDHATVYLSGAELANSAKVNLTKGINEFIFTNVASFVKPKSLMVKATNGVIVESSSFQNNYLAYEILTPRARALKDSLEATEESIGLIGERIDVLTEQVTVLQENRKISGDNNGLSVAELAKMLDLIGVRLASFVSQQRKENEALKKAGERMEKLKKQLDEEQKKATQPGGQLLIKFFAKEATTSDLLIDYVAPNASWTPTYDIIADSIGGALKLFYKANITQNTGVKWNNVKLSISTGNIQDGIEIPELDPWYLSFYTPVVPNYDTILVTDPVTGQEANVNRVRLNYTVDGAQTQDKKEQTSINDFVKVDNSGINATFDIDLPYTIPSDGQEHLVGVKKHEIPATYSYIALPKLDNDAFLQANITNWEDLNLLPGTANIFYEGAYVGQGAIDVHHLSDTLSLSMGRDKKIIITRTRDTKLRSVRTIGTNIRETFAYNITIRNTRKEKITLTVKDQQPVSNDKDIVLEDVDTGGSDLDPITGLMKWTLTLAPNETKKLNFSFTAKYPKGKTVTNLK